MADVWDEMPNEFSGDSEQQVESFERQIMRLTAERDEARAEVERLRRSLDFRTAVAYDCGHRAALTQEATDERA